MKQALYQDVEERLANYRELAVEHQFDKRLSAHYRAQEKKLERSYLRDIADTAIPDLVRARPIEDHRSGSWAVYFIHAPRAARIKVGTTRSAQARFMNLQACAPEQFEFLGWIPGGLAVERGIHGRLSASRAFGEWFDISAEVERELLRFGIRLGKRELA